MDTSGHIGLPDDDKENSGKISKENSKKKSVTIWRQIFRVEFLVCNFGIA